MIFAHLQTATRTCFLSLMDSFRSIGFWKLQSGKFEKYSNLSGRVAEACDMCGSAAVRATVAIEDTQWGVDMKIKWKRKSKLKRKLARSPFYRHRISQFKILIGVKRLHWKGNWKRKAVGEIYKVEALLETAEFENSRIKKAKNGEKYIITCYNLSKCFWTWLIWFFIFNPNLHLIFKSRPGRKVPSSRAKKKGEEKREGTLFFRARTRSSSLPASWRCRPMAESDLQRCCKASKHGGDSQTPRLSWRESNVTGIDPVSLTPLPPKTAKSRKLCTTTRRGFM